MPQYFSRIIFVAVNVVIIIVVILFCLFVTLWKYGRKKLFMFSSLRASGLVLVDNTYMYVYIHTDIHTYVHIYIHMYWALFYCCCVFIFYFRFFLYLFLLFLFCQWQYNHKINNNKYSGIMVKWMISTLCIHGFVYILFLSQHSNVT